MDVVRGTLWLLAGAGMVACWAVSAVAWSGWEDAPGEPISTISLGLFSLASAGVLALSMYGRRVLAVPLSMLLLGYGWLGTWAYGFLWVPGAVAVVACFLPRPRRAPPDNGPPSGCDGRADGSPPI